jgi:hypothetical protein
MQLEFLLGLDISTIRKVYDSKEKASKDIYHRGAITALYSTFADACFRTI